MSQLKQIKSLCNYYYYYLFILDTSGKHKQHEARSIVNTNTHTQKNQHK